MEAIKKGETEFHGWEVETEGLARLFSFKDFPEALAFVNEVGRLAEIAGHHPDIDIRWNRVSLRLVTHSEGGSITDKDYLLAKQIDDFIKSTLHSIEAPSRATRWVKSNKEK